MIVLGIKCDPVGRLFNRRFLPQQATKDIVDPFERQWHANAQGKASVSASGGFVSLHEEQLQRSTTTTTTTTTTAGIKYASTKQSQIDDASRKNNISLEQQQRHPTHYSHKDSPKTNGEDNDRERIGDSSDARFVVVPQAIKDETIVVGSIEKDLPLCSNEDEDEEPSQQTNIKSRHETETEPSQHLRAVPPSAIAKTKRSRKRNRVVFVGNQTLLVKPNQIETIIRCEFMDLVEVSYIPPISEYSREVLKTLWYTIDETERMKHDFFYQKQISSSRNGHAPPPPVLTTAGRSHNLRFRKQQRIVAIVLQEQEKQRRMFHKIYGRLVDSSGNRRSSGILNPERLRDVYVTEGKTPWFREEALLRAARAYHLVVQQCDVAVSVPTVVVRDKHNRDRDRESNTQALEDEPTFGEWSSIQQEYDSSSGLFLDLSAAFNDRICCIFFTLLTPFLEQREGPLFLDVGEEMLVAS